MKKAKLYIVIGLLILSVCFVMAVAMKKETLREVKMADFFSAVERKEKMVVYYGQEDCSACQNLSAMLKTKSEFKEDVYYLDADSLSSEDKKVLEQYYVNETPTLIVTNDGKLYFYRNISTKEELEKAINNTKIDEERVNKLQSIDYEELEKKYEKGTDFFLYIGRTDCRDCQKFYPILEKYIEKNENKGMYYFDIKKYRDLATNENADAKDVSFYDELKDDFNIEWVPSVYHIRNNMIIDKYEFLNEEYYKLDATEQKIAEKEFVDEFYNWMEREFVEVK